MTTEKTGSGLTIPDDKIKQIEQFNDFKHLVSEISKTVGLEITSEESFLYSLVLLRNLLGEDKLNEYISKMKFNNWLN